MRKCKSELSNTYFMKQYPEALQNLAEGIYLSPFELYEYLRLL